MKVYVTDEKELIMEPVLKWARNPDITIAVKAFGLEATVQMTFQTCFEECQCELERLLQNGKPQEISLSSYMRYEWKR
uniref:Uncharacterized protein n=2 Tax=Salix viminalis TaxID=40686 RepID=A0A6N2MUD1_SALVM